jgi:hypothetical protein
MSQEPIWIEDISILFQADKLNEFVPQENMSFNQKLNSTVRFSLYLTIILYMYNFNYLNLYIIISVMLATYVIYSFRDSKNTKIESINDFDSASNYRKKHKIKNPKTCRKPTKDNPFMNWRLYDKSFKKACDINDSDVKNKVEKDFGQGLYQNIGDVYQKNNSQRQYYTVPVSSGINEQTDFANWLYKVPPTCKEGNGDQCVANNSKNFLSNTDFKYRYH